MEIISKLRPVALIGMERERKHMELGSGQPEG